MGWLKKIPGFGWTSIFDSDTWAGLDDSFSQIGDWLGDKWDDWTGKSAVEMQNDANLSMAKFQQQMEEELYNKYRSPQAIMNQYKAAGLNPNLIYGSASAGIGSSPHFNAPHVERNMSGSEKVNTALSAISQILGLKQALYQTDAAREAATQAAVKTANDDVNYRRNAMDYIFDSNVKQAGVSGLTKNHISFSSTPTYERYFQEFRKNQFNQWLRNGVMNEFDFGGSSSADGRAVISNMGLTPYYQSRNLTNALKYKLTSEIGNMGTYGKLFISLLDLLK